MRFVKSVSTLTLAALSFSLSAVAQSRVCIGGDLDHLSQAERTSCSADMQAVRKLASTLHAPDGWHFVVVCGEEGWKSYAAFSLGQEAALMQAETNTDFAQHETYFRDSRLNHADASRFEQVVAHEIANLVATGSEKRVAAVKPEFPAATKALTTGF